MIRRTGAAVSGRRAGRTAAGLLGLLLAGSVLSSPAYAQKDLRLIHVSQDQHANPGESILFSATVQNNESTPEGAELVIISTNQETGAETVLADVGSGAGAVPPNGGTFTFQERITVTEAGIFTITFRVLDGNSVRVDQINSAFPLHVGTDNESLRVFPEVIHLGTLPPGRSMHPQPIEVRWSRFRFNRIRLDQPFFIRIYTDNASRYHGVKDAIHRISPAGLVSEDGKYVIPLKTWNLNYGPDIQETGWDATLAGPPPVDEDDFWRGPELLEGERVGTYEAGTLQAKEISWGRNLGSAAWVRVPDLTDMTSDPLSWRRMIGQDPHDTRFVADENLTGDVTLASPFTFYLATEAGPTAVEGTYSADLIVELWEP